VTDDVLVVYGHVEFNIRSGKLQVNYGHPLNGGVKHASLDRGTNGINHLVVLTNSGQLTFDALKWFIHQDMAITFLGEYGDVLSSFVPDKHISPVVKRRQATADWSINKPLAVGLLRDKLTNQRQTLTWLRDTYQGMSWWTAERYKRIDNAKRLSEARETGLFMSPDVDSLRVLEAQAAAGYWQCFEGIPLLFRQAGKLPACWQRVGGRSSPKTGGPRKAVDPFNAGLNYCYAVLETMVKKSCISQGIDPDFGIFHADRQDRASLVFDLMEPIRPEVDKLLLDWMLCRKFELRDFFETREGVCKVGPAVIKEVIPLVGVLEKNIAAVVKEFARSFKNKNIIQKPMWAAGQVCQEAKPKSCKDGFHMLEMKEPEPVREEDTAAMRVCFCGKGFKPASVRQKFCSGRCLDTAKKRRQRLARTEAGKCPQCGKPMPEAAAGTYKETLSYCRECKGYYQEKYREERM